MLPLSTLWLGRFTIDHVSLNGVDVESFLSEPLSRTAGSPCGLVLCLVSFQTVLSHGVLLEASPTHGSVLRASPDQVVLHFNAILEPSITQVNLIDVREGLTLFSPLMGED